MGNFRYTNAFNVAHMRALHSLVGAKSILEPVSVTVPASAITWAADEIARLNKQVTALKLRLAENV